jgi:hypothetical protein
MPKDIKADDEIILEAIMPETFAIAAAAVEARLRDRHDREERRAKELHIGVLNSIAVA